MLKKATASRLAQHCKSTTCELKKKKGPNYSSSRPYTGQSPPLAPQARKIRRNMTTTLGKLQTLQSHS